MAEFFFSEDGFTWHIQIFYHLSKIKFWLFILKEKGQLLYFLFSTSYFYIAAAHQGVHNRFTTRISVYKIQPDLIMGCSTIKEQEI